jgi:hypothetical protein
VVAPLVGWWLGRKHGTEVGFCERLRLPQTALLKIRQDFPALAERSAGGGSELHSPAPFLALRGRGYTRLGLFLLRSESTHIPFQSAHIPDPYRMTSGRNVLCAGVPAVGVLVGVAVGVPVGVAEAVAVAVGDIVDVAVAVLVGDAVEVGVLEGVAVRVGDAVGVQALGSIRANFWYNWSVTHAMPSSARMPYGTPPHGTSYTVQPVAPTGVISDQ